jgi:hypothetical protein
VGTGPISFPAREQAGMDRLLDNLWSAVAAGIVLTVIIVVAAHAIAGV